MLLAHVPVEAFHQQGFLALEELRQLLAGGEEMFGIEGLGLDTQVVGELLELLVQPVLVGQLVLELLNAALFNQRGNVGAQLLGVVLAVQLVVHHMFSPAPEPVGEALHGLEEGHHFLDMVFNVVGLLAHFGDEIKGVFIIVLVPAVLVVELVAED